MYEIRINNRELIDYLLSEYLGLSEKAKYSISKLIDKKAKISKTDFISKVDQAITAKQREDGITEKLLSVLEAKSIKELPKEAQSKSFTVELAEVIAKLKSYGISNVKFDSSLMRGFDYYTGIVFEVFDLNPENNRSMLGGGRYDGLVGLFGVAPVPTVGFGWGDVTLINFLEGNNLLPNLPIETGIYIVRIGDIDVQQLSSQLRSAGINVAVDLSGKKIGDQIKTADKKGISRVIIVGDEEINSGKYKLKNLTTGDEKFLDIKGLIREIV